MRRGLAVLLFLFVACSTHVERTDDGLGVLRPDPDAPRGTLSKAVIRGVITAHDGEVEGCYRRGLDAAPNLHGRIVVNFIIAPDGTVQGAALNTSDMGAPPVETCVVAAVRTWRFPPPNGNGIVVVNYPWVLNVRDAAPPAAP